jgi:LysR family transcriptional regulator, transcriptional activator of the cysJI operon
MLDFKVRVFYSAATSLSFTRAAHDNLISQPAVSKAIRQLEQQLGHSLFERSGSKLALTPAGALFKDHIEKAIQDEKHLLFDLGMLTKQHMGSFTLGASTTISQYIIPKILLQFSNNYPKLEVKLLSGNTNDIEQAALAKTIDLGIVEGLSRRSGLRYTPFREDRLRVVCHRSNPLYAREGISVELLKTQPLILRENGSGTLEVIEHSLREFGLRISDLNVKLYLGSTESIKNALEAGTCIAILSEETIRNEVRDGSFKMLQLPDVEFRRTLSFVLSHGVAAGIAESFIQFALLKQ